MGTWTRIALLGAAMACAGCSDDAPGATGSHGDAGDGAAVEVVFVVADSGPPASADVDAAPDAGADDAWTDGPGKDVDAGDEQVADGDEEGVHCGSGSVQGLICGESSQAFVDGALVWIDTEDCEGNPVHRETVSDDEGYYTLDDVPNGLQTIHVKGDDFETTYLAAVPAGGVSDLTGAAHKLCYQATSPTACEPGVVSIPVASKVVEGMADIVLFIDTSGSMDLETQWVKQNLNAFAQIIGNANVDFHVVLIGEAGGDLLCVPEPLGGPGCTDGPSFRHVHAKVGSDNGLEKVAEAYPLYKDVLRAGAVTNFIAVTDDNSDEGAGWFTSWVNAQTAPGFSPDWVFHSIVAMGNIPVIGCIGGAFGGLVYLELSNQTGGSTYPVCSTDWTSMFEDMAASVVDTLTTSCIYALPDPDQLLAADDASLAIHGPDGVLLVPEVDGDAGCAAQSGWYVDDPTAPSVLVLCPQTCEAITTGELVLSLFCDP